MFNTYCAHVRANYIFKKQQLNFEDSFVLTYKRVDAYDLTILLTTIDKETT